MNFALYPPEVNSGRMYAGPGAGPMTAAAAAWDALAAELHTVGASAQTAVAGLTATSWQGPSSAAMTAAVAPYLSWVHTTAAQAEETAAQLRAAVVAFEAAFTATVPPPVIAANRSLLMSLVATNILGQNTAAIAATEAHYVQMWAQDVAAMVGYAAAAAAATAVTPFSEPPSTSQAMTAEVAGAGAQGAGVPTQLAQLSSVVPAALQQLIVPTAAPAALAAPAAASVPTDVISTLTGAFSPIGVGAIAGIGWLAAMQILGLSQNGSGVAGLLSGRPHPGGVLGPLAGGYISATTPAPTAGVAPSAPVTAGLGKARLVSGLAVPPNWASAAPSVRTLAAVSSLTGAAPAATGEARLFGNMAMSSLAGSALGNAGTRPMSAATTARAVGASTADEESATSATIIVIPAGTEGLDGLGGPL
ncbi:PPE family protein [Mycolicibacillus parakoreensis]|uniref:PPE family protein n=1 Tax=Mycolicibacillus parakoreensis TaxID=1069221 RepID=A0ABY3U0D3_9MYCO|nr:PPE family protein [Mycolicibacillus parakoreensis]MCV7315233.1 PPE family protein [Mycolicibacillus parakoreensis]ULN53433.1 PPE family protein [Mycolicibacillus parakoreensis]